MSLVQNRVGIWILISCILGELMSTEDGEKGPGKSLSYIYLFSDKSDLV